MDNNKKLEIKKYRENFYKIYRKKIRAVFHKFEKDRKKRLARCIILTIIFAAITVSIGIWGFTNENVAKVAFHLIFIACIITLITPSICNGNFITDLKTKCMPELVKAFDNLHWQEVTDIIDDEELNRSSLFSKFNRRSTDDSFVGKHSGVNFRITETDLSHESGSGKNRTVIQVFKGVIIRFDFNKTINSKTIIATKGDNKIKSGVYTKHAILLMVFVMIAMLIPLLTHLSLFRNEHFGTFAFLFFIPFLIPVIFIILFILLGKKNTVKTEQMNKVFLEDVEFDKKYDVYSEDQIEARYLITPAFMERFKHISTAFGTQKAKCSFYDDKLMFAITTNKNLFEIGNLFHCLMTKKYVNDFLEELISIIMMIDYFKLDEDTKL